MEFNKIIRERGDKSQVILSYKGEDGIWKQRSRTVPSNNERMIEDAVYQLRQEIENNGTEDLHANNLKTFEQFGAEFVKQMEIRKQYNTSLSYKAAINTFNPYLGFKPMSKITKKDVQAAVDQMNNLNASTIKAYLTRLKKVFKSAIEDEMLLAENPIRNIEYKGTESKRPRAAITKSELDMLLDRVDNLKHKLYLCIAGTCGLRGSEMLGLVWDVIDMENSQVEVKRQWKKLNDKNEYGFGKLKSKNSYRTVPIPPSTLELIKRYQRRTGGQGGDRVFDYGSVSGASAAMGYIFKHLGLELTVHELRHTYATILMANRIDPKTAAALMGHSVEEYLRIYSHYTSDMAEQAKIKINQIFN